MPFEKKYDSAIRDAAVERVLRRRATHPKDRSTFRVVADEFNVGQQSLRGWVAAVTRNPETAVARKRRPRFSPVVTTAAQAELPIQDLDPAALLAVVAAAVGTRFSPSATAKIAELEAEALALRRGNDALKGAMRVLLGD